MKRRILSILSLLAMIAALLSGCGGGSKSEKVKIVVPDRVLTMQGALAFRKGLQEKFDELYGDEIEVVHILPIESADTSSVDTLTAVLLGNDAPAYVGVPSTIYMKDLYNMGLVADIAPYVQDNEEFKKLMTNAVDSCTYSDGSVIAWPTGIEVPLLGFYNSALEDAGYDPETFTCDTWDEYYEIAKKMDTSSYNGSSLYASEFFLWPQNWFLANGAEVAIQNADGTITLNYTDQRVVETVEYLRKLYKDGLTNGNVGSVNVNDMFSMMYNKQVASFTMYPTWVDRFINQGIAPDDITLRMFPTGPSGERKPIMYVAGFVFNSQLSEEELKAAIKYVSFMYSEEQQTAKFEYYVNNGISDMEISCVKGVDWKSCLSDYPQQWLDIVDEAMQVASDNKINATGYSTYLSAKLPAMIEGNGNIRELLKEAEQLTENEWLNDYNKNAANK